MGTTKVKNIEIYSDSQGEHIVATGRLIFSSDEQGDWKKGTYLYIDNKYMRPIIISEVELLPAKTKCKVYSSFTKSIEDYYSTEELKIEGFSLVLALPEHFSPKHTSAIADGKLKDGDEVYVECRNNTFKDFYKEEEKWHYYVKLINNHIKLFPVKARTWKEALTQYEIDTRKEPIYLSDWLEKHYPLNK